MKPSPPAFPFVRAWAPLCLFLWACSAESSTAQGGAGAAAAGSAGPASQTATPAPPPIEVTLIEPAKGPAVYPGPADTVKVHYQGTFTDGREFDSSYKRGQPATFPLNRVIPCWTQGVQRIPVGATAMLKCPSATAYGAKGAGNGLIPPHTDLVFKVQLLEIVSR